jgi:hypothetical protein
MSLGGIAAERPSTRPISIMQSALTVAGDAELGYCNHHGGPAIVVPIGVHGWQHRLRMCSACLMRLAEDAREFETKFSEHMKNTPSIASPY